MATVAESPIGIDDAADRELRIEALERLRDDGRPRGQLEAACVERCIDDLRNGHERGLIWDGAEADRAVKFFGLLSHWKGRQFAGNRFTLEPWQEELWIRPLFGWKRQNGLRRFTSSYVELPRKQGKSTVGAAVGLYCLVCDHEDGAEVYAAATSREQAKIVFTAAQHLARGSRALRKHVVVWAYSVTCPRLVASFKALSAESESLDGLNAHCVIIDELHKHKSREMLDVLTTSTGARLQPIIQVITTAGDDRTSVCWEEHQRAGRIVRGELDDAHHVLVVGADDDDDPFAEDTWRKANPNLGVSIDIDYLRQEAAKAKSMPSYENTFRRNHLDQWTSQEKRWLQMHRWDACKVPADDWPDLRGVPCYAGLDMASTSDVNALAVTWKYLGRVWARLFCWIPSESIGDRQGRDRRQVLAWAERGSIKRLPGNTTDYELMAVDVAKILREHDVRSMAYDPWGPAPSFIQSLERKGIARNTLFSFGATINNFAVPTRELERLVTAGEFAHDGDEVFRWMAENCAVWEDGNGNKRPSKKSSGDKIDGIVAEIMALARLMVAPEPRGPAVAPRGYRG